MKKYGFVYIWFDCKKKKYYIGSHWGSTDDGYICSSNRMRNAYRRRPSDFKRRILVSNIQDRKYLLEQEEIFLKKIEKKKDKYYNLKFVTGHWHSTKNLSEKLSNSHWSKNPKYNYLKERFKKEYLNKVVSEETKLKMSKARLGKKLSNEVKNNMKNAQQLRIHSENFIPSMLGKFHSEETKLKIGLKNSISQKGKTHSEETKRKLRNKVVSEETKLKMSKAQKNRRVNESLINAKRYNTD